MRHDSAGHARHHGVRVPVHVLRACIRLGVPGTGTFSQGDGFHEVVALVDRLTVRHRRQAVEQCDAQPPAVGVGCVGIEGLGQPVGGDVEEQAMSNIVHASAQPLLMNFKRVVAEVHAVRNDEVDHRVEVAVKHASVDVQDAQALLEETVRRGWRDGREVRVAHGRFGERPRFRTAFERFDQPGRDALKGLVGDFGSALAHAVHLLDARRFNGGLRCQVRCSGSESVPCIDFEW